MNLNKNYDIGEVYRETFRDFSREPSPAVWDALEQQGPSPASGNTAWMSPAGWIIGAAGVGIITAALVFFIPSGNDTQPPPATELTQQVTTEGPQDPSVISATDSLSPARDAASENAIQEANTLQPSRVKPGHQPAITDASAKEKIPAEEAGQEIPAVNTSSTMNPILTTNINSGSQEKAGSADKAAPSSDFKPLPPGKPSPDNTASSITLRVSPDKTICSGQKVRIGASGGSTYYWSTGEMTDSIEVSPESSNAYRVTAYNNEGYSRTAEVIVNVGECAEVFIPNTFTPNYDGINDEFIVIGKGIIEFQMIITDKSGLVLFESNDITRGWDGKSRGQLMETGNYFYQISYIDANRQSFTKRGRLILLR